MNRILEGLLIFLIILTFPISIWILILQALNMDEEEFQKLKEELKDEFERERDVRREARPY